MIQMWLHENKNYQNASLVSEFHNIKKFETTFSLKLFLHKI